ncbi:MAG: type I phosphomannose isomerase catalytic subunit [Archaeoglobaceae archaeon]
MLPKFIFQARENLVEKPWGGEWIAMLKGFHGRYGESWEFSAHPSNPSEVLIGGKAVSMLELFSKFRKELLGSLEGKYDRFPILVKLLDVSERLSVQVHPSDEVARELGEDDVGKDEAWLCLSNGKIYAGFSRDLNREEFEELVREGRVLEVMNSFEASPLDTFRIDAGVVHAAEGVRLFEVSTNSNLTYRVQDFYGREVDVEKVLRAVKLGRSDVRGEKGRIETEKFGIEVVEVKGAVEFAIDTFNVLFGLEGFSLLRSDKETAELHKGYSCLVPASTENYTIISESAKVVRVYPK